MNIFAVDDDPILAAQLGKKHLVKMPLESAQILCTVAVLKGHSAVYKPTHVKHPSVLWVLASGANWAWLCQHGVALCRNYTSAFRRRHKCQDIIENLQHRTVEIWGENFSSTQHTPFALAMPDKFKTSDPVQSYRNYYYHHKAHLAVWANGIIPTWYPQNESI